MGLKELNLDRKYVISMQEFLYCYYNIEDLKELLLLSKLTHAFLKSDTNIDVNCVSFDHLYKDEVYIGDVILVKDCAGNIAPYKNPLRYQMKEIIATEQKKTNEVEEKKLLDLTILSYSKLLELKNKHKDDDLYQAIMYEIYSRLNCATTHSKSRDKKLKQKSRQKRTKVLTYKYARSYK